MGFLQLSVPMPPSDNHIYFNTPRGRAMTSEAKKYKSEVQRRTAEAVLLTQQSFAQQDPHIILLDLFYAQSEVLSAQKWRPFKKNDASNRTKLLIDAVTEGAGFDDGGLFCYLLRKNIAQDGITHVDVTVRLLTEDILAQWNAFVNTLKEVPSEPERSAYLGLDQVRQEGGG